MFPANVRSSGVVMRFDTAIAFSFACLISLATGGCASVDGAPAEVGGPLAGASIQRPQDTPVALGKRHFAAGEFGLAEQQFQAGVEANPKSAEAWLGLAASYDQLKRFDLADEAYRRTIALQGENVVVLNNLGYHHLLQGHLGQARHYLTMAAGMEPGNPQVQGNLALLKSWKSGDTETN